MRREPSSHLVWRRSLTRRDLLRGAGLTLGGAIVGGSLIGCGGSKGPEGQSGASSPTSAGPKRGGTLYMSVLNQMADLNPQGGGDNNSSGFCMRYVCDHLFNYDYFSGKADLSLAASIENPDPLTYIFKIKPEAKHGNVPPVNGRTVTSEDVVVSWKTYEANPRLSAKEIFTDYIASYDTPDEKTMVLKMKKPWAWAISSQGFGAPFPTVVTAKELCEQNLLEKVSIGPGGYLLDEFDPASVISFKRRPDGWHNGPDRPYIDKMVFRVISDPAARSAALKAKQIDQLAARDKIEADDFKSFGPDMNVRRERTTPPVILLRADAEGGYFADPRVREAIYTGLNIQDLIDRVELGEAEYTGAVSTLLERWALPQDELKKYFPNDLRKAKELLAAGGWDASREVEYKYPSSEKESLFAQVLQKQFADIGIKTKLVPQDPQTVWRTDTYQKKNFQMTSSYTGYGGVSPDPLLKQYATVGRGAGNDCRWGDKELDDLIQRQSVEFDFEKQRQLILDAQRLIFKKFAPAIKPYTPFLFTGVWKYFTNAGFTQSYAGTFGGYSWIDTGNPAYPKR